MVLKAYLGPSVKSPVISVYKYRALLVFETYVSRIREIETDNGSSLQLWNKKYKTHMVKSWFINYLQKYTAWGKIGHNLLFAT